MKKIIFASFLGILFLGSCAQDKEKREEYKNSHNKDFMRNSLGDTVVANTDSTAITVDSTSIKTNTPK